MEKARKEEERRKEKRGGIKDSWVMRRELNERMRRKGENVHLIKTIIQLLHYAKSAAYDLTTSSQELIFHASGTKGCF